MKRISFFVGACCSYVYFVRYFPFLQRQTTGQPSVCGNVRRITGSCCAGLARNQGMGGAGEHAQNRTERRQVVSRWCGKEYGIELGSEWRAERGAASLDAGSRERGGVGGGGGRRAVFFFCSFLFLFCFLEGAPPQPPPGEETKTT